VATPVNLLFFVTMVLLILVSVQLSFELSRHEGRIRRLAEEVALLQQQIDALDKAAKDENDDNR
jgi:cell division protein ZapA (FtsZ GTPase activity inhibitor)